MFFSQLVAEFEPILEFSAEFLSDEAIVYFPFEPKKPKYLPGESESTLTMKYTTEAWSRQIHHAEHVALINTYCYTYGSSDP